MKASEAYGQGAFNICQFNGNEVTVIDTNSNLRGSFTAEFDLNHNVVGVLAENEMVDCSLQKPPSPLAVPIFSVPNDLPNLQSQVDSLNRQLTDMQTQVAANTNNIAAIATATNTSAVVKPVLSVTPPSMAVKNPRKSKIRKGNQNGK